MAYIAARPSRRRQRGIGDVRRDALDALAALSLVLDDYQTRPETIEPLTCAGQPIETVPANPEYL